VGDSLQIRGFATAGTPTGANASLTMPSGLTIDTAKIGTNVETFGDLLRANASATTRKRAKVVMAYNSTNTLLFSSDDYTTAANPNTALVGTSLLSVGEVFIVQAANLPILGWSAATQMSDQTDTRIVAASASRITSGFAVGTAATKVQFNSVISDTHGALDLTTNYRYTIPVAGKYQFSGAISFPATASFTGYSILLYKNGGAINTQSGLGSASVASGGAFSFDATAIVGDYFEIWILTTGAATTVLSGATINGGSTWDIKRISGPSAIAATESVNAVYTTAAGQSIANNTTTIIDFGTKEIDTHGSVTTGASWKFTAQSSGTYEAALFVQLTATAGWGVAEAATIDMYKGGVVAARMSGHITQAANGELIFLAGPTRQLKLLAGEYIDFRIYHLNGAAVTLNTSASNNWVSIKRVGN
jgi:hypothetical protein